MLRHFYKGEFMSYSPVIEGGFCTLSFLNGKGGFRLRGIFRMVDNHPKDALLRRNQIVPNVFTRFIYFFYKDFTPTTRSLCHKAPKHLFFCHNV